MLFPTLSQCVLTCSSFAWYSVSGIEIRIGCSDSFFANLITENKLMFKPNLLFALSILFVAAVVSPATAAGPWSNALMMSSFAQQADAMIGQPEGVTVKVQDGHAIVDFSQRAATSNVVSELVDPLGDDIGENPDAWAVTFNEPLVWCLKNCRDLQNKPEEFEDCIQLCWDTFGNGE